MPVCLEKVQNNNRDYAFAATLSAECYSLDLLASQIKRRRTVCLMKRRQFQNHQRFDGPVDG